MVHLFNYPRVTLMLCMSSVYLTSAAQDLSVESSNGTISQIGLLTINSVVFDNGLIQINTNKCQTYYHSIFYTSQFTLGAYSGLTETTESDKSITIYPNPAKNLLTITNSLSSECGELQVFNFSGEVVLLEYLYTSPAQIDLSQLAPGLYFIRYQGQTIHFSKL